MTKIRIAFVVLLVCIGVAIAAPQVDAQASPITFTSVGTVNDFPAGMEFSVSVSSSAADITAVQLVLTTEQEFSSESSQRIRPEFEPGNSLDVRHDWLTPGTVVPSTPIRYYWEVTDEAGNIARTADQFVRYDDIRYEWDILENEQIAVWWHDRPAGFGEQVFAIAQAAVREQRALFGAELAYQLRIIIYNNYNEFAGWNPSAAEFIGGQAFPSLGITTQIVSEIGDQTRWLNDVVPHEISHLYFGQITYNPTVFVPVWLNEGVAQFNEFNDPTGTLRLVENVAASGDLLILSTLNRGFGFSDEARTRLAYAEALSATVYLVETYGEAGLAALLAAYRDGQPTDEAMLTAFGVDFGTFQTDWALWLGLSPDDYVTPTPWPLPTFPASPTPVIVRTATPGSADVGISQATTAPAEPSPAPPATATTAPEIVVQVVPTATVDPERAPALEPAGDDGRTALCGAGAAPLALLFLIPRRRRRDRSCGFRRASA